MSHSVLGLDVGQRRIGVALGNEEIAIATPLTTLLNDETLWQALKELVATHDVSTIIVGLPRGMEGQETEQTRRVIEFMEQLRAHFVVPLYSQDEAVTSIMAERELKSRGKPYEKGEIDALAATYILQDYLDNHRQAVL